MPAAAPILIAGPTASGKSALAVELARAFGGMIINADSMQVYRELPILSARPAKADLAQAPHRLYGHVSAAAPYSVGHWVLDVTEALVEAKQLGLRPIIVGGTGLYFKALIEGLSPIPQVPAGIRRHWREKAAEIGAAALHALLAERDPVMAARLNPTDPQRVTRALEVLEATGRSLAEWQRLPRSPVLPDDGTRRIVLMPDRTVLNVRCEARFDAMVAAGAVEEARKLGALGISPEMPVMRALGVPPLLAHLAGECSQAEAVARAKQETKDYVKRQRTWLHSNMIAWHQIMTQFYDEMAGVAFAIVRGKH